MPVGFLQRSRRNRPSCTLRDTRHSSFYSLFLLPGFPEAAERCWSLPGLQCARARLLTTTSNHGGCFTFVSELVLSAAPLTRHVLLSEGRQASAARSEALVMPPWLSCPGQTLALRGGSRAQRSRL